MALSADSLTTKVHLRPFAGQRMATFIVFPSGRRWSLSDVQRRRQAVFGAAFFS
ncbi:hypothetical protein [Yersinia sp. 2541 StPb PI]|uniref:hypothetical protein n=1 Tax=Yersinia sp. 2541 StPb PI TaxID=3117407 RepID=UPI003FA4BE05